MILVMLGDRARLIDQVTGGLQVIAEQPQDADVITERLGDILLGEDLVDGGAVQVRFDRLKSVMRRGRLGRRSRGSRCQRRAT